MANYRKSFNLRNGVQVDDDNFIVNANGLVGIGTSIPSEFLDVNGNAKISGLTTTNSLYAGIATINSLNVKSGASISGIVTATSFSGNASGLTGIYAIAVDGWYVTPGSISTTSKVGIGTTIPNGVLQIGTEITFNSNGNATYSGVVTASSFNGSLDSSNLTGTIDNSRLPSNINISSLYTSGIVTAVSGFVGNLTGVASTASSIVSSANINVNSINSGFSTSGISTIHNRLNVLGNIGVGTTNSNAQIHLRKTGISSIQLTSDGSNSSTITFGRNVNLTTSNAQLRFGNTNPSFLYSTEQSLDIINYDTGNLNFYLNPGGSGTGSYNWFKPSLGIIMTLNGVTGNLGINSISPSSRLSVVGDAHVSGVVTSENLKVNGNTNLGITNLSGNLITSEKIGINTSNPLYALQVGNNPSISNGIGISSSGNVYVSGIITSKSINVQDINSTGIITSTGFDSGYGIFNVQILSNTIIFNVPGVGSTSLTLS